jgi:hypothetical protein
MKQHIEELREILNYHIRKYHKEDAVDNMFKIISFDSAMKTLKWIIAVLSWFFCEFCLVCVKYSNRKDICMSREYEYEYEYGIRYFYG